ncbi:MAG: hypothetical protein Q4D59_00850 [Erysipelotrichaceae bacterium]|jgi:hypothetical protein|nr:hypothetical protein [Erysipelotrichaceae bacterium]
MKDYFSFESIRDKNGEVICYHITMIGTIEADGVARIRTDLGTGQDKKMAFGRLTVRGVDKKIAVLLKETNSRIWYHSYNEEDGATDIISYTARDWRADEAYEFSEGDRVLVEGRAYIRDNAANPARQPELSVTATGLFLLGRKRRQSFNSGLIPQK